MWARHVRGKTPKRNYSLPFFYWKENENGGNREEKKKERKRGVLSVSADILNHYWHSFHMFLSFRLLKVSFILWLFHNFLSFRSLKVSKLYPSKITLKLPLQNLGQVDGLWGTACCICLLQLHFHRLVIPLWGLL